MTSRVVASANREPSTNPHFPAIGRTVEHRLRSSGYRPLCDISCTDCDGVVYLHGCLPSYYLKQLAQEIGAGVAGVRLIINKIDVRTQTSRRPVA